LAEFAVPFFAGTEVADSFTVMRIAIPVWDERVSPIFDVARWIRVVDIADGGVTRTTDHRLENQSRASGLVGLGVDLLICAAISTPLAAILWVSGIEVMSDTCGPVDDIVTAYVSGDIDLDRFRSPGCGGEEPTGSESTLHSRPTSRPTR
jgi:predicted Fe-Mo cluster-binding NifX family protein